jgi:hypothetical protein
MDSHGTYPPSKSAMSLLFNVAIAALMVGLGMGIRTTFAQGCKDLPKVTVYGRTLSYPDKKDVSLGNVPPPNQSSFVFSWGADIGGETPGPNPRMNVWLRVAEDTSLNIDYFTRGSRYSMSVMDVRPGNYVAVGHATYKVLRSGGQDGNVLERNAWIDLERVDRLPNGGKACFIEPVFSLPLVNPKWFPHDTIPYYETTLYRMGVHLYEPKEGDRTDVADLNIARRYDNSKSKKDQLPFFKRWVTVSKDSVFELRNDKEMKVWLKVVDFVPRNDELGITGWIRVMRVDEPATPPKPDPSKQQPPEPAQPKNPQPAKP